MSILSEKAAESYNSGFNCAQSVLSVFCEKYGLGTEEAYKVACGLGGGLRSGEVCGAVSGAVIVIGLRYGHTRAEDKATKDYCYKKTIEFMTLFKKKHGCAVCRDILGYDISTTEGYEKAQSENLFKTVCVSTIKNAVELLEELGY